jgi:trans-aconitate methyltransferase
MTHYDLFPYPDPSTYTSEQVRFLRNDNAPRVDTWEQWWPGEAPAEKEVLVIGCGVYEALSIAVQAPLLNVLAIDNSPETIVISRGLARKADISNVKFVTHDIMKPPPLGGAYDLVIASGVMHHIRDDYAFVQILHSLMGPRSLLSLMMYGDCMRRPIADFRDVLRLVEVPLNEEGIKFTRDLLSELPIGHPVREFWNTVRQNDSQIVDLFLHPYARHYAVDELLSLLALFNLRLVRWFNDAVKPPPMLLARCEQLKLTEKTTARIAQILNHADAKLAGLFRRGE